jgi:hypothetical protein
LIGYVSIFASRRGSGEHLNRQDRTMKRFATVVAVLALLAPAPALAASSTCQAYNPQLCNNVSGGEGAEGGVSTHPTSSGSLPFTGLDLVLLVVGGGTLVGAGVVVRRLSRRAD